MLPFFLERAREWRTVADALRARGSPEGDPALGVWREAAWCHLLLASGRYDAIAARLRVVLCDVAGTTLPDPFPRPGVTATEVLSAAAELFERLRTAVSVRHPNAFGRPAA